MLKPHGYAVLYDPQARDAVEHDTITCSHCQRIVWVKPRSAATVYLLRNDVGQMREEPGAFCRVCMKAICLPCCDIGTCTPWERQLEIREARDRLRRAIGA